MNRRSFFGTSVGAIAAGPSVAKEALASSGADIAGLVKVRVAADLTELQQGLADSSRLAAGVIRSFSFAHEPGPYVYRTGYPAIDALRSISGVHKALMEKRWEKRL